MRERFESRFAVGSTELGHFVLSSQANAPQRLPFLDRTTPFGEGSVKMLDGTPKPRLGALLDVASAAWRSDVRAALDKRRAPALGAGADLLAQITLAGISQSLLAERLGLSKQAVQQSLDQLERLGLVRRAPDPVDKRAKYAVLTETGLLALEARRDAEREVERAWQERLGKKAFGRLRKTLRKVDSIDQPGE
jgi:DNA-binding MarR family transcriptional regulator